jgi:hypothetical protein
MLGRRVRLHADLPELVAHHDPGEPSLKWGCPIEGCGHWVIVPHDLGWPRTGST